MNILKQQLRRFLFAGVCAVVTDFILYYILINFLSYNIAKGVSFIVGSIVAYMINKYYTFENKEKSYKQIIKFIILYTLTLLANISANKLVLHINIELILLAFLVATAISTILNFLGQKYWVFKS
jgi:putative flippase GtrA